MSKKKTKKKEYYEAVGRRKNAVARVRLYDDSKNNFVINEKQLGEYFSVEKLQIIAKEAFEKALSAKDMSVSVLVKGGGKTGQAEAIRLGVARALEEYDPELRSELKAAGFLKRDPRVKERKKFGLKKARKAAQWSKR